MVFSERREAGRRLAARLRHLRSEDPVVVALPRGGVPVAAEVAHELGETEADAVVCAFIPRELHSVGQWYADFGEVTDDEVLALLAREPRHAARSAAAELGPALREDVDFQIPGGELHGQLVVPDGARGLVVFAHGSGSGRQSPRNRRVAALLHEHRLATLLFDLLTEVEATDRRWVFDIPLLAERLAQVVRWSREHRATRDLPVGLFGASTGAGAALVAAAALGPVVRAVVSRGGRPDLAGERLEEVWAPTLLIVGSRDESVTVLNRIAAERLAGVHELAVVEGAGHVFEEPGALERVADLAGQWFTTHLRAPAVADVEAGRRGR